MPTRTITTEEYDALIAERDAGRVQQEVLKDQLRTVTVERDLLKERLAAHLRQLFAAKSEARGSDQKDLFLNEAEALAPSDATAVAEEVEPEGIEVAGHTRKKRGRKPLDRRCRARLCVMNCRSPSGSAVMTARHWWKSVSRSANSSTSFRSRYG